MKLGLGILALFMLVTVFDSNLQAVGVSPAYFFAQNVPLGVDQDTGIDISVDNNTDYDRIFTINTIKPIIPGDESLQGFGMLPDSSWFYVEKNSLNIVSHKVGKSRVHIKIPNEEKYHNQHWAVSCLVQEGGETFMKAGAATIYFVETEAKADPGDRPYGPLGLAPSLLVLKEAEAKKEKPSITIYNNSGVDAVYKIRVLLPDTSKKGLKLNYTTGFSWFADKDWVKPTETEVKIEKGGSKKFQLEIKIPEGTSIAAAGNGLEAAIFVESDARQKGFVRLQIIRN